MRKLIKSEIIKSLVEKYNLEDELYSDDDLVEDLEKAKEDDINIFVFAYDDQYSCLVINDAAGGSKCIDMITFYDRIEDTDDITTELLAALVLNRHLKEKEEDILEDAMELYALVYTEYDELYQVIKNYTRADDTIDAEILYPIQLFLFLLFADAENKKKFLEDIMEILKDRDNVLDIVWRYLKKLIK